MIKNYHIRVTGIVQGVWFRKYTKEAAIGFGLTGRVSNESDGSVFVIAEGKEVDLELFVQWLYKGSPLSKVEDVQCEEGVIEGFNNFEISR